MSLEKNLDANTQALNRNIAVMEKLLSALSGGLPTPPAPASVMSIKSNKNNELKSSSSKNQADYNLSDVRAALIHIANKDSQHAAKTALKAIAGVSNLSTTDKSKYADLIHYAVNEYQYEVSA